MRPDHAHHMRKMADMIFAAAYAHHFNRPSRESPEARAHAAYSFACYTAHLFKAEHRKRLERGRKK